MKTTEFHIAEYIKTDEDVHNLLAAEREPYEKALRKAIVVLELIKDYPTTEIMGYYGGVSIAWHQMAKDMAELAKRHLKRIRCDLKKEGIPDPTELKDTQCEEPTLE